jgi:hypothetical protein
LGYAYAVKESDQAVQEKCKELYGKTFKVKLRVKTKNDTGEKNWKDTNTRPAKSGN